MPHSRIAKFTPKLTNATVSTLLLANAFVWYLSAFKFLQDISSSEGFAGYSFLTIIALNFIAFVISAFIGILIIEHFTKRATFLKYWIMGGLFVSFLFAIINFTEFSLALIISGILGAYFGLGMPTFAGFFSASTEQGNRAKFGGTVVLLIVLAFPIITLVGISDTYITSSALALWLALGLGLLAYFKPAEKKLEAKNEISYRSVFTNKTFLLYIIPWLMFSLVNDLVMQTVNNYFQSFPSILSENYIVIENLLAGGCAIVFGFLADKKGRKRLALIGFVLLGIGYAALGLFSKGDYFAVWFYVCVDGIAWGAFTMLFITTLWGDIAQEKNSEKYYLIGILPYLCSTFANLSIGNYIANTIKVGPSVFSYASFMLFVAILPLIYAPETLSDRIIRDIDLNSYVNKALEKVQRDNTQKTRKREE